MNRHDPGAEPRPVRPRRNAMHDLRQPIATVRDDSDDAAEFCAVEVPPVARAIGVEAYRRQVDAMAHDRAHGISQADAMRDARRRRAGKIAADAVKDLDGAAPPMLVATLILEALERDGVL